MYLGYRKTSEPRTWQFENSLSARIGEGFVNRGNARSGIKAEGIYEIQENGEFLEVRFTTKMVHPYNKSRVFIDPPAMIRALIQPNGEVVETSYFNIERLGEAIGSTQTPKEIMAENMQNYFPVYPRLGVQSGSRLNLIANSFGPNVGTVFGEVEGTINYNQTPAVLVLYFIENFYAHDRYPVGYAVISQQNGMRLYAELFILIENFEGVSGKTLVVSAKSETR